MDCDAGRWLCLGYRRPKRRFYVVYLSYSSCVAMRLNGKIHVMPRKESIAEFERCSVLCSSDLYVPGVKHRHCGSYLLIELEVQEMIACLLARRVM